MKTLQRILSLFLVLALLFSLSTAVFAADAPADNEAGSDAGSGSSGSSAPAACIKRKRGGDHLTAPGKHSEPWKRTILRRPSPQAWSPRRNAGSGCRR